MFSWFSNLPYLLLDIPANDDFILDPVGPDGGLPVWIIVAVVALIAVAVVLILNARKKNKK